MWILWGNFLHKQSSCFTQESVCTSLLQPLTTGSKCWWFSIHTVTCEINRVLWSYVLFLHLTHPRFMELFLELFYRVYVIATNFVQTLGCIELFPGYVTLFSWSLRNYFKFGCIELFPGYVTFFSQSLRNYFEFVHTDYSFFDFYYVCSDVQCSLQS